jgi:hypothetical protein
VLPIVVAAAVVALAQPISAEATPPGKQAADLLLSGIVETGFANVKAGLADSSMVTGRKPAAGARVSVSYLDLDGVQVGEERFPQVLTTTTTDSHGHYQVHLTPDRALLEKAASNGGYLNLELGVDAGSRDIQETVPAYWNGSGWGRPDRVETLPSTEHHTLLATDPKTGAVNGTKSAGRYSTLGTVSCSFVTTGTPTRYTKVVEFHNTAYTSGRWTYGTSADSDIDVGLDYDGNGGWGVSGTAHIGTSLGSNSGVARSGVLLGYYGTTNMQYLEGYYQPYGTYSGYTTCSGLSVTPWTKSVRATKWLGGTGSTGSLTQYDCYDAPQSSYRNNQLNGSFFSTSSSRAAKFSGSANFSYISLGATSGYSTNIDLHWDWNLGRGGYSCGSNAYPPYAKIIYVN